MFKKTLQSQIATLWIESHSFYYTDSWIEIQLISSIKINIS